MSEEKVPDPDILTREIDAIKGLGPVTQKKFNTAGIYTVMDLSVCTSQQLAEELNMNKDSVAAYIVQAQQMLRDSKILEEQIIPARKILEKRETLDRISLGCKELDDITGGGIETQAITEFYGEFGSGKSQICFTLCAIAPQKKEHGGLEGGVIFIDTEGTFRPERILTIAKMREFDPHTTLDKIMFCKIYNSAHMELTMKDITTYIQEYKARLIIIDSIVSLHRAEFTGRGTLAERQQKLNSILHRLLRIAETFNIAIVITNQVITSPGNLFGDPIIAAGGNIIAHTSTYRIYLRKSGHNRICRIVDSPSHPYSETKFSISEIGTAEPTS
jgi:DNA repair protein RadA